MPQWAVTTLVIIAGLALMILVGFVLWMLKRFMWAPNAGTIEHISLEARREDMVGEARVKRINQLAAADRALYMLLEMGPDLFKAMNAGDAVKLRSYGAGGLQDLLGQFNANPMATSAMVIQFFKDAGLWKELEGFAKARGIDLAGVSAPKSDAPLLVESATHHKTPVVAVLPPPPKPVPAPPIPAPVKTLDLRKT